MCRYLALTSLAPAVLCESVLSGVDVWSEIVSVGPCCEPVEGGEEMERERGREREGEREREREREERERKRGETGVEKERGRKCMTSCHNTTDFPYP